MSQGLDHATWMPLSPMYSSGKVPIVQVSLPSGGSPDDMMAVGKALAPLRQAGVMLVGTGTAEFLDPLFFVLGASMEGDQVVTLFEGFHAAALSLRTRLLAGRRQEDRRLPTISSLRKISASRTRRTRRTRRTCRTCRTWVYDSRLVRPLGSRNGDASRCRSRKHRRRTTCASSARGQAVGWLPTS
jgi:Catalytic LigB subunit of aromatic ring-opening dioxygenase